MKTHWNNLMLYDSCCGEKPRCTSYPWGPTFEAECHVCGRTVMTFLPGELAHKWNIEVRKDGVK